MYMYVPIEDEEKAIVKMSLLATTRTSKIVPNLHQYMYLYTRVQIFRLEF